MKIKFLKSKGQYVLKDRTILTRILRYAEIKSKDVVLEVGCGTGSLTRFLLRKAKKVYGIEIDKRFIRFLSKKFKKEIEEGRFELIHGDALKIKFPCFNKFVSNIPYQISSPLTFKLLKHDFEVAVVTYQKEFAERLVASPGSKNYGRLSVITRAYCKAEILEMVPSTAFLPTPKVTSAIVKIVKAPQIKVKNLEIFEDLVKFAFTMRRKKFGKILDRWCKLRKMKVKIPKELEELRPDAISPEIFAEIADKITKNTQKA